MSVSTGLAAAIQMASGDDREANLREARRLMTAAVERGARLLVLPENFAFMGATEEEKAAAADDADGGEGLAFLQAFARENRVWVVGGSLMLKSSEPGRFTNTSFLAGDDGEVAARYDKIHLFDVNLGKGEAYRESDLILAGKEPVVAQTPFGILGLSVCYDLRFPELYRRLAAMGATLLAVPSAFTLRTGQDHWELLLRARAVENFSFVLAANQGGRHPGNRRTYGHSMIVEPWGMVIGRAPVTPGFALAEIDPRRATQCRAAIPCLDHRAL